MSTHITPVSLAASSHSSNPPLLPSQHCFHSHPCELPSWPSAFPHTPSLHSPSPCSRHSTPPHHTPNSFEPRGRFRNERPSQKFNSPNRDFVGNLPWGADDLSLEQRFSDYGKVVEAKVVYDRETRSSRGFGFVTLSSS